MTPYEKELYSHYNDVLRFANSLTKNMDDAKDLTQTVFLKCLEHATAENHNSTNVKGFLFVITKNTFITSTKRKKTEPIEAAHNIAQHDTVNIDIQAMTRCEITRLKGE